MEAKLKFKHNHFEIISNGDYVICAVSKKNTIREFKLLECRIARSVFFPS